MLMEISNSFEPLDEPKKGKFFGKNFLSPFSSFPQKSLKITEKQLKLAKNSIFVKINLDPLLHRRYI